MQMDKEEFKKSVYDWIKTEKAFMGLQADGVEIVSLPSSELLGINIDGKDNVTLRTNRGEYRFLGIIDENTPGTATIQISDKLSVTPQSVTKIDQRNKMIWVTGKGYMVDVDRWEYFLQRMERWHRDQVERKLS